MRRDWPKRHGQSKRRLALRISLRYGKRCEWLYASLYSVLGWKPNLYVIRLRDICRQFGVSGQPAVPHRDDNTYSRCGVEQHLSIRQGLRDAQCEHPILVGIHHRLKHHPAGHCKRQLSGDFVGQRLRKFTGGERVTSQSLWSKDSNSVLLLNVPGAE
jgi:hypothetical protein